MATPNFLDISHIYGVRYVVASVSMALWGVSCMQTWVQIHISGTHRQSHNFLGSNTMHSASNVK